MNTEELLKMKEKVQKAEQEISNVEGRLERIEEEIKSKFNIESMEEVEYKLQEMDEQLNVLENEFESGMKKLEEDFRRVEV
jgi:C4-type Zn-finger protein